MAARLSAVHAQPGSILLVVHDFIARSADELSLTKGDRIELIERDDDFGDGWFLGRHLGNASTGLFPEVYTTPVPKATLPTAHNPRRAPDGRPMVSNGYGTSASTSQSQPQSPQHQQTQQQRQQSPSLSSQQQQQTNSDATVSGANQAAASALAQSTMRNPLPSSNPAATRTPSTSHADSPVMNETLSVINEHITDMSTPRTSVIDDEMERVRRSSVYSASQPVRRFSYIPGHETDEDEHQWHTEAEVMSWSPDHVAEYLEDHGVERIHCDVFRDQEISGEVLLAMDQSSLFIKEFQLGPVGRRLKTWHKIKALQDEVKRMPGSASGRPVSQYSSIADDSMMDRGRNRSSTVNSAAPRLTDESALRYSADAAGNSAVSTRMSANNGRPPSAMSPGQSNAPFARAPEHTYRPSAQSIRTMSSRRHSSIDSSHADAIARYGHRKQSSVEPGWQSGNSPRIGNDALPGAVRTDTNPTVPPSPSDQDRGYYSSNDLESKSKRRRSRILHKAPPVTASPSGATDPPRAPSSLLTRKHSDVLASATSASSQFFNSMSNKFGTLRSATAPAAEQQSPTSTEDIGGNPVVTKLEYDDPSLDAITTSPVTLGSNEGVVTPSPHSAHFGFFGKLDRSKIPGFRTTSDAVTKEEKSGISKDGVISPTHTGTSTPSTETKSFDMPKSDLQSRTSNGSGSRLVPPPRMLRSRNKTKKDTSAYTRGLEKRTPSEAIADCDYSGWMEKKSGSMLTTWKTRLFILRGRRLSYYYSNDDTEEKGLIDISFHRVLPAHNEMLTNVHAAVTRAGASATSPREGSSVTAAERDLQEVATNEAEDLFIFKLVPPKAGLSKAVNFTKPTVHYFAVNSRHEGRLWMAALMKATIDRDEDGSVTTTYNQKTISLKMARARRERPPALREDEIGSNPPATPDDAGLGIGGLDANAADSVTGAERKDEEKTSLVSDDVSSAAHSGYATPDAETVAEKE